MVEHSKYTCPICFKTALDMTHHWEMMDREIEATIMPPVYRYKVLVLCNDCNNVSEVNFHVVGHSSHCHITPDRHHGPQIHQVAVLHPHQILQRTTCREYAVLVYTWATQAIPEPYIEEETLFNGMPVKCQDF